jgi:sec-independent protein translocase protein TatB
MFNLGGGELLVIALIALIVLGPTRLPEAARTVGKVMGEIRRLSTGFQNEVRDAFADTEPPARQVEGTPLSATVAELDNADGVDDLDGVDNNVDNVDGGVTPVAAIEASGEDVTGLPAPTRPDIAAAADVTDSIDPGVDLAPDIADALGEVVDGPGGPAGPGAPDDDQRAAS